jgi:hypothetical protein
MAEIEIAFARGHRDRAKALVGKGTVLQTMGRGREAIVVPDEVFKLFSEATESSLREQVAQALIKKGETFRTLERSRTDHRNEY